MSTRQLHDSKGETLIYKMKETIIPSSHKRIIEQTPQSYGVRTPENDRAITGDQLSFNAVLMRQFCDSREEAFNPKINNYTPGQTLFTNEASTSESSTLEDPQLPISPKNTRLGNPNKEIKKNVQFCTPENNPDQRNSVNIIYDPILITPRQQHSNLSLERSFQETIKGLSPYPPLNPKGRYFSGMVENGKGGDFFGYYCMPGPNDDVPVIEKTYFINESTTNPVLPQGQRHPQTTLYNQDMRHQDTYPIPLQWRETSGIAENQGNYKRGPCFNCKEYGHYSRDCPETCGPQDTFIKKYYPPHQDDIPVRPLKTEAYPRHYYHSRNSYQYKEGKKEDDEEGYPLSDFEESTIPSKKGTVSEKHRNPRRVKPEHQSSDSDGDESNDDTYMLQKLVNTTLDMSHQVNDVLSKLVEHQAAMQDKNLKVMETLVNCSTICVR